MVKKSAIIMQGLPLSTGMFS